MNNYYEFSFYNKPWNKVSVYSLGVMSAMLYIDIKKQQFENFESSSIIKYNWFVSLIMRHRTKKNGSNFKHYFPWVIFFIACGIYYEVAFCSYPIQLDPFSWSDSENAIFYALTRPGWALATMTMYFLLIAGHSSRIFYMTTSKNMSIVAQLTWPAFLLSPIIFMNMYSRTKEAIYMTMMGNSILGMGGMCFTYFGCIAFMFLF